MNNGWFDKATGQFSIQIKFSFLDSFGTILKIWPITLAVYSKCNVESDWYQETRKLIYKYILECIKPFISHISQRYVFV